MRSIHSWAREDPRMRAYRVSNMNPQGFKIYTPFDKHTALPSQAGGSSMDLLQELDRGLAKLKAWEIDA